MKYINLEWVKTKIYSFDFLKNHEKEKNFNKYIEEINKYKNLETKEYIFEFECEKIYSAQRPRAGKRGFYAPDAKYKNIITKNVKQILEEQYPDFELPSYHNIRVEIIADFQQVVKNKFETCLIHLGFMKVFKKPDVDNIAKIHLDACNGLLWEDDAHITKLLVEKRYNIENAKQNKIKIRVIYN